MNAYFDFTALTSSG